MAREIIRISDEFITLGQLLKVASIIGSGGMAKWYLSEHEVYVDGELEQRRGKKLYDGAEIFLPNESLTIVIEASTP
ncbi:MAG: S4 domain-containing protein YaaA [Aerococcaceae bacterium]|nr:S4 domain-containing protein YaaA [Aerococcaceae bacterium]